MKAAPALAAWIAARGRWFLVAGLALGLGWPALAAALQPFIAPMVAFSLYMALLRQMHAGPGGAPGGAALRGALGRAALGAVLIQGAIPMAVALGLLALGLAQTPLALGLVLILAAAPITGAAPIAVMMGAPGDAALRQTMVGTALLPLTILPALLLLPALGDPAQVAWVAARMLGLILLAGAAAWITARRLRRDDPPATLHVVDALQALVLALVVIGLMGGAGEALRSDPLRVLALLAAVSALAFGMQGLALAWRGDRPDAIALAIASGNRNVALLLGALPAEVVAQILVIVGLYQIPMYLTPLVLPAIARRLRR